MFDETEHRADIFFLGVSEIDAEPLHEINKHFTRLEELDDLKIPEFAITSLSLRTGKKFCISIGSSVNPPLKPENFIEIVDYDPVRNSALALGKTKPNEDLPLHWFTYRTFSHINGIAVIKIFSEDEAVNNLELKSIKSEIAVFQPDLIMDILPLMKDNVMLNLREKGIIFYNHSFQKLADDIIVFLKKLEKVPPEPEQQKKGENK